MKRTNSSQIIKEILLQVKGLDVIKCELCNETQNIQLHHIDNNPNNNKIANLILLCKNCHSKAHENDLWRIKRKKTNKEKKERIQKYNKRYHQKNKIHSKEYYKKYYENKTKKKE